MTGARRTKEDPCYHRHHDATSTPPVRCDRCKELFASDGSFRDHIMWCVRKESKIGKLYVARVPA